MSLYYFKIVISIFFDVISFAIIIKILLSWVNVDKNHPIVRVIEDITAPILALASKVTPKAGMLDFSPLIAIIAIDLIKSLIMHLLG